MTLLDNLAFMKNNRYSFGLSSGLFFVFSVCFFWAISSFSSVTLAAANSSVAAAGGSEPSQMLDFSLSGYGSNGDKTWEVEGASMDMLDNEIAISDITAKLYGAQENMVLTADNGRFDKDSGVVHLKDNVKAVTDSGAQMLSDTLDWSQKEQSITTKDQVNVIKGNMSAQGTGIHAKPDLKVATFKKDVVVTINSDKKSSGSDETGDSKIVITCDGTMEMDYEKQIAVFQDNVKVEGDASQGTMFADKMTATFQQAAKQIDKIVAEGNVRIVRGENVSTSDSAVFTAKDRKMILTGRPKLVIYTEEGLNASP